MNGALDIAEICHTAVVYTRRDVNNPQHQTVIVIIIIIIDVNIIAKSLWPPLYGHKMLI